MKNKADRSTHKPSFTVGDIAYVYRPVVTPGRQRTFIRPWVGTFYIAQQLSPLHVKIRRKSDGKLIKNRVHIHWLKHGFACVLGDDEIPVSNIEYGQHGNDQTQNDVQLNNTDNIVNNNVEDGVFEVEEIFRKKYVNGK